MSDRKVLLIPGYYWVTVAGQRGVHMAKLANTGLWRALDDLGVLNPRAVITVQGPLSVPKCPVWAHERAAPFNDELDIKHFINAEPIKNWRHKKRGTLYAEILRATLRGDGNSFSEGQVLMIYLVSNGDLVICPAGGFIHGVLSVTGKELGSAELQDATGVVSEDCTIVIYCGEDNKFWARAEAEFEDGRFENCNLA